MSNTPTGGRVLLVDDDLDARKTLRDMLESQNFEVRAVAGGFQALGELRQWDCDVVLTDLRMPILSGLELVQRIRRYSPHLPCIVMTGYGSVETAVEAMRAGADDFLTKPLQIDVVSTRVRRAVEKVRSRRALQEPPQSETPDNAHTAIVGESPAIQSVTDMVDRVAASRATVLLTGETGTGKELVARRLHEQSPRSDHPFVALHCAALAESLLESELFGHEKGSFTGANRRRAGRFEQADGGTIFLDEIGDIPPSIQVKLLRVLQEQTFERVGGEQPISVDVRVVAATHSDLTAAVNRGDFRKDLYFRLDVINIDLPPLRARTQDIPLLTRHFVRKYADRNDTAIDAIDPKVFERLESYDWPGNVRELENTIERAVVLTGGTTLRPDALPDSFDANRFPKNLDIRIPGSSLDDIERYAILKTYESTGGQTKKTADILDISTRKVQYKLKEYRNDRDTSATTTDNENSA